jgi:hypothetical protein
MNDVMLSKPVKTQEKQVLPLIDTDSTDLERGKLNLIRLIRVNQCYPCHQWRGFGFSCRSVLLISGEVRGFQQPPAGHG